MSNPTLEPATSDEQKDEETIREEVVNDAKPKDMRFWLVMVGLLFVEMLFCCRCWRGANFRCD